MEKPIDVFNYYYGEGREPFGGAVSARLAKNIQEHLTFFMEMDEEERPPIKCGPDVHPRDQLSFLLLQSNEKKGMRWAEAGLGLLALLENGCHVLRIRWDMTPLHQEVEVSLWGEQDQPKYRRYAYSNSKPPYPLRGDGGKKIDVVTWVFLVVPSEDERESKMVPKMVPLIMWFNERNAETTRVYRHPDRKPWDYQEVEEVIGEALKEAWKDRGEEGVVENVEERVGELEKGRDRIIKWIEKQVSRKGKDRPPILERDALVLERLTPWWLTSGEEGWEVLGDFIKFLEKGGSVLEIRQEWASKGAMVEVSLESDKGKEFHEELEVSSSVDGVTDDEKLPFDGICWLFLVVPGAKEPVLPMLTYTYKKKEQKTTYYGGGEKYPMNHPEIEATVTKALQTAEEVYNTAAKRKEG